MRFVVTRCVRWDGGTALKAFCDVAVDRQLLIRGIRIVAGRRGPFISMPRTKSRDDKWHDVLVPLTRETKIELSRIILEAFQRVAWAEPQDVSSDGKAQHVFPGVFDGEEGESRW